MSICLAASGYAITECGLTAIRPGDLTADREKMTCRDCRKSLIHQGICPECGEKMLTWSTQPRNKSGVADGRLTMRDVETTFHLGCDGCSETLYTHVDPETVAAVLTEMGWRP